MPRFACPHCGDVCTVSESSAGKKVRCPGCDRAFLADDDEPPEEAREPVRRRDDDGVDFRCPFCGTDEWPNVNTKVSTGGWVLFVGLLIFCFPLCFIGLLVKEDYRECSSCGVKLG
jgi:predicted RNA-binding Zn-ribbon protein involved in translation (DUF1610 family)